MRRPGIVAPPGTPTDKDLMLGWRPGAITCTYPYLRQNGVFAYKAQNPQATIIVRFPHPRDWYTNPEQTAVQHAKTIASRWAELRPLEPFVIFANELNLYYENGDTDPANQPLYETEQFLEGAGWWITRTAQLIKNLAPDMKLVTPPFSPGRHDDGSPDDQGRITDGFAAYDFLADAMRTYFDSRLAYHAYWGDINGSDSARLKDPQTASWYAFRWRRLLAMCRARYNLNGQLVIDEAANFATYDPDFFEQITYFSQHALQDPRVLALTFFIWEDPTFSPGNIFNVWTQYIPNLADFTRRLAEQPDILPAEGASGDVPALPTATPASSDSADALFGGPSIRVMFNDGRIETMTLETYLRAVVPAEVPATWHAEALKAQAVAARSYAANAIRRARYAGRAFDIRANPDVHQNYRSDKVHPATDAAVLATQGLVLIYNRHPIDAVYSANCGGHTFNSEAVFKKPGGSPADPTPYLRGVPCPIKGEKNGHGVGLCQYGANALARKGLTFDKILAHYYQNTTLASWQFDEHAYTQHAEELMAANENWSVKINRSPGFPVIVGNLADRADIPITVQTPTGETFMSRSGTKLEFGKGGFEALAPTPGLYTLSFRGQSFKVQMDGQTTVRLDFSLTDDMTEPPARSILKGVVMDQTGHRLSGRTVALQLPTGTVQTESAPDGSFIFENLPAGTFTLSVPNTPTSQAITFDGQEFKSTELVIAVTNQSGGWLVEATPQPGGLPLLVGDIGQPNEPITVVAPSGAKTIVVSGGKPEYGPGGFEIYAPEQGIYTLQFLNKQFTIPMEGQMLHLTFRKEAETPVRLVSTAMPRAQAEQLLRQLQNSPALASLFSLEEA